MERGSKLNNEIDDHNMNVFHAMKCRLNRPVCASFILAKKDDGMLLGSCGVFFAGYVDQVCGIVFGIAQGAWAKRVRAHSCEIQPGCAYDSYGSRPWT